MLKLDHIILRSPDADRTFADLVEAGFPPFYEPEQLNAGMRSGIVRAGAVDIEVLSFTGDRQPEVSGYGLGFRTDGEELPEVAARLRQAGIPTSAPMPGRAGEGADERTWSALFLGGLLPDGFPAVTTTHAPDWRDRLMSHALGLLGRIPAVARASAKRPGSSMVVVTEYGFDIEHLRASKADGPSVESAVVGIGDAGAKWADLGELAGPGLELTAGGPTGVLKIAVAGASWDEGRQLALGAVQVSGRAGAG